MLAIDAHARNGFNHVSSPFVILGRLQLLKKYLKEIRMRGKDICRGCSSTKLFQALDLGYSPLANRVIEPKYLESAEPWFPLVLRVCQECKLGQLGEFTSDAAIFRDYPYLSSTSSTWLEQNKKFANQMTDWLHLSSNDLVIELASNDGYLLQYFMEREIQVLGIEPALNVATIAAIKGVPTSPEFFSKSMAEGLLSKDLRPKLIIAKNVVAHVPDIQDFLAGVSVLANESTLVVIEAPSILNIVNKMQFDTIYHEHFSYLSASFLNHALPKLGLKLVGIENVETHGGSLRFFISTKSSKILVPEVFSVTLEDTLKSEASSNLGDVETWVGVAIQVNAQIEEIRKWISNSDRRLIGYGAAAKVVTLLSAAQVPRNSISLCIDNSEGKMDRFIPGSHIQIVSESEYLNSHARAGDTFVIFPWNLKSEIAKRIREFDLSADIFVLLPTIMKVL